MDKQNIVAAKVEEPSTRITRARAKTFKNSGGICPVPKPSFKENQKHVLRGNTKRTASDDNKAFVTANSGLQHKRRAVLKDVTNVDCENSNANGRNATKVQVRVQFSSLCSKFQILSRDICLSGLTVSKVTDSYLLVINFGRVLNDLQLLSGDIACSQTSNQAKKCTAKKNTDVDAEIYMEISEVEVDVKAKLAEELSKIRMGEAQEITSPAKAEGIQESTGHSTREVVMEDSMLSVLALKHSVGLSPQKEEENRIYKKQESSSGPGVVDIDSNQKDFQVCGLYASDIYNNTRVKELDQRPSTRYMERLQHDITPSMRGILIDWLVEVSEEYRLVPDTLYLTVNLIDRFLSGNYIEKQRLQLLGVTCMLIASKYEEICAPRVEEFCFITDNTYTRREVLKMESQVLNFLYFQISVPTTKTFLRRFIQAAHASYKVPRIELEFLSNYLAELTLVEYDFLKFLPSLIAASAVFLARWTLDQSDHPWNPTLEHYTSYNASELKTAVLALEDLQLNINGCSLNAIRDKYRQQKFKYVATLTSPQRVLSVFER